MWRYRGVIPIINDNNIVTFQEGNTPLTEVILPNNKLVWIKQDHLFPTGSYKDRGASVLISKAKELGVSKIIQDSSGNAGAAIAAYAAAANIPCEIYLPEETSLSKIVQIEAYGAKIIKVPGSRKDTAKRALMESQNSYYASHSYNPYFFQGTKTFAYELAEQLNWNAPDILVIPAGNGTLLLGCYIGFHELVQQKIIQKMPKLVAVQSEKCSPLFHYFHDQNFNMNLYEPSETIAEGIAIPNPVRLSQMFQAIKKTGGDVVLVSDSEIIEAWKYISRLGYFIEPTSAATIAGLINYSNNLDPNLKIASVFTGSGLKSIDKIQKILGQTNIKL
ncbi:MAG: threonine synthase [Bacteroidia bacterium]|nr:threonine synthase [Bacteroidia bacterium]MCF8428237.1 threonine synthase [Bacteroidia bacterium]MCF8446949.1 threonine synthase [Bacteroidia bacterium]